MTNNTPTTTVDISAPEQSAPLIPSSPASSAHSHSSDMSPLTAILSLLVLIAVPALIYAFFFAINCPRIQLRRPSRRGQGTVDSTGGDKDAKQAEMASCGAVKYEKEADHEDEYGSECPVCLSAFAEGDWVRRLNACEHSFHVACIDKWLLTKSNCPVCRSSVPAPTQTARPKRPARRADDDLLQGLPDAASLV